MLKSLHSRHGPEEFLNEGLLLKCRDVTQETEPREDVHGTEAKLRPLTSNLSVGISSSLMRFIIQLFLTLFHRSINIFL